MVHRGPGANNNNNFRLGDVFYGIGNGAGTECFQQRGDRGGVTEAGAVIDIIGFECGPDQFLEQIGLFITPLG